MGEKISREALDAGEVDLSSGTTGDIASPEVEDAALGPFLMLLARDMASHPERLQAIDVALRQRLQSLVGEVEIDLNAALSADDE